MISLQLEGQRFQVRAARRCCTTATCSFIAPRAMRTGPCRAVASRSAKRPRRRSCARCARNSARVVDCGPLLHIAENFFDLAGRRHHEIGFYFLVGLDERSRHLDKSRSYRGIEDDLDLEFRWFPLTALASIDLRPTFLQTSLLTDPPVFSHAVQREY